MDLIQYSRVHFSQKKCAWKDTDQCSANMIFFIIEVCDKLYQVKGLDHQTEHDTGSKTGRLDAAVGQAISWWVCNILYSNPNVLH